MSEFGKGLVICLVKFAEHAERDIGSKEKGWFNAVDRWFNAASDHLYDIEVPAGKEWDAVREKVATLQERALKIGHGFTGGKYKKNEIRKALDLAREIALMIDKVIGLKPDIGDW